MYSFKSNSAWLGVGQVHIPLCRLVPKSPADNSDDDDDDDDDDNDDDDDDEDDDWQVLPDKARGGARGRLSVLRHER